MFTIKMFYLFVLILPAFWTSNTEVPSYKGSLSVKMVLLKTPKSTTTFDRIFVNNEFKNLHFPFVPIVYSMLVK